MGAYTYGDSAHLHAATSLSSGYSATYDAAGNVTTATTTLPAGTDNQAFCYDEQNRLTWASSQSGSIPCGGTNTGGSLTAAQYTQSFGYDTLGRLTSGPLGSYSYGPGQQAPTNPSPLHAALSIGSSYTAKYDGAGNMTCRAPTNSTTCSGTQTGAQLSYDAEGRLSAWQNAPSSPTTTDGFLYDGEGQRVEQQVTTSGSTTTTVYIGELEEVATTGSTTTTTTYYYAGTQRIAEAVNGVFSYLARDGLGSASLAQGASGTSQASILYAPYGTTRYTNGTMPTDYGFTGQRSDTATTGLEYYGARYYDPVASQFSSADTVLPGKGYDVWGLSRYAYVEGNPETRTDPSGHLIAADTDAGLFQMPPEITFWRRLWDSMIGQGVALQKTRAALLNEKTEFVRAHTRGGRPVRSYLRRPRGNAAEAAEAAERAEKLDRLGKAVFWVGVAIDFGVSAGNEWMEDPNDPTGLRVEKAAVAGTMHTVITAGVAWGMVALVSAIPGVDPVLAPELQFAAGIVGGELGGWVADQLVTPSNVDTVTNAINTFAQTGAAAASNVGTAISNAGNTLGNAASAVGSVFSGLGL